MTNGLYAKGKQALLQADIDWLVDDIKIVLVDTALYTVNLATDQFLSSIPSGARVFTSGNLSGKTAADGVADASDVTMSTVTGASVEAVVIYRDSGSAATSALIAYIDTATGLPVTPNGGDIVVQWDNGPNRIFAL